MLHAVHRVRLSHIDIVNVRDGASVVALGMQCAVLGHLEPSGDVRRQRLRSHDDRVGRGGAAGHLPLPIVVAVFSSGRIPETEIAEICFVNSGGIIRRIAPEIETETHGEDSQSIGDEQVCRRGYRDPVCIAHVPDNGKSLVDGAPDFIR